MKLKSYFNMAEYCGNFSKSSFENSRFQRRLKNRYKVPYWKWPRKSKLRLSPIFPENFSDFESRGHPRFSEPARPDENLNGQILVDKSLFLGMILKTNFTRKILHFKLNFAIFSWIFLKNFYKHDTCQFTEITPDHFGDRNWWHRDATASKQVTSSCGTVSRSDFLKKIQDREFLDFCEIFLEITEFFKKKTLKNLDKRFWQNDKKNSFWESVYRSLSLLTGNEWWRHADVMMTSFKVTFWHIHWLNLGSVWILKNSQKKNSSKIWKFVIFLVFDIWGLLMYTKMDALGFVWSATWFSLSFGHIFENEMCTMVQWFISDWIPKKSENFEFRKNFVTIFSALKSDQKNEILIFLPTQFSKNFKIKFKI